MRRYLFLSAAGLCLLSLVAYLVSLGINLVQYGPCCRPITSAWDYLPMYAMFAGCLSLVATLALYAPASTPPSDPA